MKAIIALVLAFAITANCGLLKNVPAKDAVLSLAQIDQHPLGKSLLSLMSLHMKAEGPLEDLPILLQQINDDVSTQWQANEDKHVADEDHCKSEGSRLSALIALHGHQWALDASIIHENAEAIVRLEGHLETAQLELQSNEERTTAGQAQRDSEHATYETDIANIADAIDAVREATTLLNSLRAGTSFVQLKGKMQKIQARLESTKSTKHTHIYTPLLKALAQITSKADKEIINRILDLLSSLETQLVQGRATIEETEATQAALWASELENLIAEHKRLVDDIDATETELKSRRQTVEDATSDQSSQGQQIKTNTAALIVTQNECAVKRANYALLARELDRELELIVALQDHFNARLAGLTEYISSAPQA